MAAYGLIVRDRRILLCRISDRLPHNAGLWTLPGGGLDFGEDPAEAVVREVREETGLVVRPLGVAGIDSVHLELDDRHLHGVRILYRVALLGGDLRPEVGGTTDLPAWWTLAEARALPLIDLAEAALPLAFDGG